MSETLRVEQREGWRKLTLNRPDKLNAANEEMLRALLAALDAAEADASCRALLLTGAGRGFCAGQELGPAVMPGPDGPPDLGAVGGPAPRLRAQAALGAIAGGMRGERRGGGRRSQLCARLRHRAGGAQREIRHGVREDRPGAGFRRQPLPDPSHRRGPGACPGDAGRGRRCDARRSLGNDLESRGRCRIAAGSRGADCDSGEGADRGAGAHEAAVRCGGSNSLDAQLDLERDAQAAAGRSADYAEGVRAFLEKRAPVFRGA